MTGCVSRAHPAETEADLFQQVGFWSSSNSSADGGDSGAQPAWTRNFGFTQISREEEIKASAEDCRYEQFC